MAMQPISWLKQKYSKVSEGRSFSQIVKDSFKNFKDESQKMLFKLKHLEESNENLAYFHFDHGNINDAIFRFKLVNKVHKKAVYNFYLARLYWEKNKLDKAKFHIDKYTAHNLAEFKNEAKYQEQLVKNQLNDILEVPEFFVHHNFRQFYFLFQKQLDGSLKYDVKSPFFDTALDSINKHFGDNNLKILDLGCADGVVGACAKRKLNCEEIVGVDLVDKLVELASKRTHKGFAAYHQVIEGKYDPSTLDRKFDIVIAEEFIKFKADFSQQLQQFKQNLDKNGLLIFTYLPTINKPKHEFINKLESFAFNEEYIKQMLQDNNFILVSQKKVKYSINNIKTVMIAAYEK